MAFLEVITRTFGQRPTMLQRNLESLTSQTDPDWTRRLVVDDAARGVAWAVGNLATVVASGEYVWVLDDDDVCARATLVAELKTIAYVERPHVIMVRAFHERFGLLPSDANWEQAPVRGNVGTSCYMVRADLWNRTHDLWVRRYDGDFVFIDALWRMSGLRWYWHDVTAAWYPQQSVGAPEELLDLSDGVGRVGRVGGGDAR